MTSFYREDQETQSDMSKTYPKFSFRYLILLFMYSLCLIKNFIEKTVFKHLILQEICNNTFSMNKVFSIVILDFFFNIKHKCTTQMMMRE